jgi:hypothetical protein
MKKKLGLSIALVLMICGLVFAGYFSPVTAKEPKILEFDTMAGVPQAFTGSQNPIRGVNGGGIPWILSSASGELQANGKLELFVRGLVLASGPNAGSNPIASFRGLVSCLRSDGTVENILTGEFPATTGPASAGGGNARFEAVLDLPDSCIAPIIFVTSPGGAWFAATGY